MKNRYLQILAGFIGAMLLSIIGAAIFIEVLLPKETFKENLQEVISMGLQTKVLTLGALPNLLFFHLMVKKNKLYIARGVMIAVLLMAVVFAVLKLK